MTGAIAHFEELLKTVPQRLADLPDDDAAHKPAPNRWSKKEILGHLIDSSANLAPQRPQLAARESAALSARQRWPAAGHRPHGPRKRVPQELECAARGLSASGVTSVLVAFVFTTRTYKPKVDAGSV